jgi:hypothetical protein
LIIINGKCIHTWVLSIYTCLLNYKEFRFFLIGLNSIFSTLPQIEYTLREVYSGLCLFLSIVYSVFQRCSTRDEISFPVGQSNWKKRSKIFKNFEILQNLQKFQKFTNFKIQKKFKNFIRFQNVNNNCSLFCWIYCWKVWKIPYYLIKQLLT